MLTRLYVVYFKYSSAAYSVVGGGILLKFNLIHAFMLVLITCKNEDDPIKNEGFRVLTRFSPIFVYAIFLNAQGHFSPQYLLESGRNLNSSEILWLSSLPAIMKEVRLKMKALEC